MPLPWSAYAIARVAGFLGVAAFAGSALTQSVASHLLVSDDALADVEKSGSGSGSGSADAKRSTGNAEDVGKTRDPKQLAREQQLELALAAQVEHNAAQQQAAIVEHNIFCPACQPIAASDNDEADPDATVLAMTELPLALLATMESTDPSASLATIRDTERRATGIYGIGDPVRPGVTVAEVKEGVVVLRAGDQLETLDFTAPEPPPKPKSKSKAKAKPKPNSREIPGARDAIDCKGNACTIDRSFVESLLRNPQKLTRQAKLVPAVKDGETHGFRVHRVRSGTLPRLLGLKNGDTLLAVNGTNLDSMDEALALYTKLRRASELNLTVERKGKVFEKQISIR